MEQNKIDEDCQTLDQLIEKYSLPLLNKKILERNNYA